MKLYLEKAYTILALLVFSELALSQGIDNFISNQVQSQISRQVSVGISKSLNDNLLIPQLNIRNKSGAVKDLSLSNDERYFNVLHQDGTVRTWDAMQGVQRPAINPGSLHFSKVVSASAAGIAIIGAADGKIYIYDILTAKPVNVLDGGASEDVLALSITKSENKLAAAYADGKIIIWDLKSFKKSAELNSNQTNQISDIAFTSTDKSLIVASKGSVVELWDLDKTRKPIELSKAPANILGLWESPAGDLVFVDSDANLQWLEQPENRLRINKKIQTENTLLSAAINFSGNVLSLSNNANKIQLFNLNDLSLLKEIASKVNIGHLRFINQGKHLLGADDSGVLHVWDMVKANEVMQLISTDNGWTVVDNAGRFDSSEKGMPNVSWQAGDKDIPLDNFSGNYYEPDLLATQLTSDNFINPNPQKVYDGINLPPEVNLTVPESLTAGNEAKVSFEIVDTGGGIGEQRLYQNGKIIDPSFMDETNDTEVDGILHRKVSYKITLLPGINKFKVVATNKMGIESLAQQQSVQTAGAGKLPDLYVVVVGINKYRDHSLDLSYSVKDAESIVSTLGNKNTSYFNNIYADDILDQGATKEAIVNKFNDIAKTSKANDVLIVYFAGHGIAVNGEWYFLPHETTFHPDEQYYTGVGLAAKQIESMIAKIPAEKILVMFDSCYSGSGIKVFENLKKTQRHFSRSLSKSDGIVVLAATRKDQEALESAELGHGLFTYIVDKGMNGAADINPVDKQISAHEVVTYASETIPSFTHKYVNATQEPTSFTIGDDFILLGL